MGVPPARNAAIEHIEQESRGRERCGCHERRQGLASDKDHGAEYAAHPTSGIAQGEQIRQMHAADHREMLARTVEAHSGVQSGQWISPLDIGTAR